MSGNSAESVLEERVRKLEYRFWFVSGIFVIVIIWGGTESLWGIGGRARVILDKLVGGGTMQEIKEAKEQIQRDAEQPFTGRAYHKHAVNSQYRKAREISGS